TVLLLVAGIALGAGIHALVVPQPEWPGDYIGRLPIAVLVVIGGSLFKFAEKRAEADKLRRTYTALAGSIAHEMRNPLSQLSSALENIERTLPPPTTSHAPLPLAAARLDALYGHLSVGQLAVQRGLQVIALTLGEVRSRSFDPAGFVLVPAAETTRRAVEEYSYDNPAQRERVQVRVQEDFTFRGDETIYLFILFNLLRNALYYFETHPEARLMLTIEPGRVTVRDTGPGMSEEALLHLFQPFSTSGKSDGTGLGLSYCRRAMQAFGGDIACRSAPGLFTEFVLDFPTVPADQVQAEHEARLAEASAGLAGRHILVVDDDARLRQSAARMLQRLGCKVTEADGGEWALDLLQG
ncbi:MAG: histidine kinase, partial [Variovorax sp.]